MKNKITTGLVLAGIIGTATIGTISTASANPHVFQMVTEMARAHNIDPAIAHAIVKVESGYNCSAKNPHSSATGAMQVVRGTARAMGVTGNLRDCRTGLVAGMRYLKQAINRHGATCAGISSYNTGIGVGRCTAYGRKVMALMGRGSRERYASFRD